MPVLRILRESPIVPRSAIGGTAGGLGAYQPAVSVRLGRVTLLYHGNADLHPQRYPQWNGGLPPKTANLCAGQSVHQPETIARSPRPSCNKCTYPVLEPGPSPQAGTYMQM